MFKCKQDFYLLNKMIYFHAVLYNIVARSLGLECKSQDFSSFLFFDADIRIL